MSHQKRVVYLSSTEYHTLCDNHPKVKGRASLTDALVEAYGLKQHMVNIIPENATKEDLKLFHSEDYVASLEKIQSVLKDNYSAIGDEDSLCEIDIDYDEDEEFGDILRYGFGYDCSVFVNIFDYCKAVAGASITAANILNENRANVAINLNGGWHHGHVDEAAGFCYVNDVVIAIITLMKKFKRILYVDLDIHHGDGVEEAFRHSKKVMTLSLHNFAEGFFPGTGGGVDFQESCRKHFATNVPLKKSIDDSMYISVFKSVFSIVMQKFQPDVIVCQCGADGLAGDPLGGFNLTSKAFKNCIDLISSTGLPLMLLGGGGYNISNTARCWTEVVACILGKKLSEEIPDHDYLDKYGPDYCLSITPSNRRNENSNDYIANIIKLIKESDQL